MERLNVANLNALAAAVTNLIIQSQRQVGDGETISFFILYISYFPDISSFAS